MKEKGGIRTHLSEGANSAVGMGRQGVHAGLLTRPTIALPVRVTMKFFMIDGNLLLAGGGMDRRSERGCV